MNKQVVYYPVAVTERLPETQTPVFCLQNSDAYIHMMCYVPKGNEGNRTPYWRDADRNNITEPEEVTHWLEPRPTPEPPQCTTGNRQPVSQMEQELEALKAWKESAMKVMPDFQEIGKLLGLKLGTDVSAQLIPSLRAILQQRDELKRENDRLKAEIVAAIDEIEDVALELDTPVTSRRILKAQAKIFQQLLNPSPENNEE